MWINERQAISTGTNGSPAAGSFGYTTVGAVPNTQGVLAVSGWTGCRESFLMVQQQHRSHYFAHNLPEPSRGRAISVFFDKLERQIGVKASRRTIFRPTNRRQVIQVTPSVFWFQSLMRLSLFSALLRSGMAYRIKDDNFNEALWSNNYVTQTRPAVEHFLKGHFHYWGMESTSGGWYTRFRSINSANLARFLRDKSRPKDEPIVV